MYEQVREYLSIVVIAMYIRTCLRHNKLDLVPELCNDLITAYNQRLEKNQAINTEEWNNLISILCKYKPKEGLALYEKMRSGNHEPDRFSVVTVVSAAVQNRQLRTVIDLLPLVNKLQVTLVSGVYLNIVKLVEEGRSQEYNRVLSDHIKECKIEDGRLNTALLNMFSKCSMSKESKAMFESIPVAQRDVVTWTSMINNLRHHGQQKEALGLFDEMQRQKVKPNAMTFATVLSLCADTSDHVTGLKIYQSIDSALRNNIWIQNAAIRFFAQCGMLNQAVAVFNTIPPAARNVVTWTSLLSAYIKHENKYNDALRLYEEMKKSKVQPNERTYSTLLTLCGNNSDHEMALKIYNEIDAVLRKNVGIQNAAVAMFGKCGMTDEAFKMFNQIPSSNRDIISWNTIMGIFSKNNQLSDALDLLDEMIQCKVKPTESIYVMLMSMCRNHGDSESGERIYRMIDSDLVNNIVLQNTALIMFGKVGMLNEALALFQRIPKQSRNVVTWTAMLSFLVKDDQTSEAFRLYDEMKVCGVKPNEQTYVVLLKLCTAHGDKDRALGLVADIEPSMRTNEYVLSAIINLHGKFGLFDEARSLFEQEVNARENIVCWNALIHALAVNGRALEAIQMFQDMCQTGLKPDAVTFVSLLNGCAFNQLVGQATNIYSSMKEIYGIEPDVKHFCCLVDAVARSGDLSGAEKMALESSFSGYLVWATILGACKTIMVNDSSDKHNVNNLAVAERVFERLMLMNTQDASAYVVMANIYIIVGRNEDAKRLRELMDERGAKKIPGITSVVINGERRNFVSQDRSHPDDVIIQQKLEEIHKRIADAGYAPDVAWVINPSLTSREEKERSLCRHSERIAIAWAMTKLPSKTSFTITNNLRVCGDCHEAIKYIAKAYETQITVRDARRRYHHFYSDGTCSCGDTW